MILNWNDLAATIHLIDPLLAALVKELVELFEVVYSWAIESVADWVMLDRFRRNAANFIKRWRDTVAPNRNRNYYHWLAIEAVLQIQACGSIWKYSSDITESFVHVLKECFLRFTNRGGTKRHWTRQAMLRVLVKVLITSKSGKDVIAMLTPYERKKYLATLAKACTNTNDL